MMAMRGYKRRGRPPKTPHAAPRFLNAKFNTIEKPKWLHGRCKPENQSTTSATDTPQSRYRPIAFTPRPRGRPRKIKPPISARLQERDSEYHYGSDFLSGSDSDSNLDDKRSSDVETDVDFETSSLQDGDSWSQDVAAELTTKGPTPLPVWLEERSLPPLNLPESSQDLLLPAQHLLDACGIYEVLRRFSNLLRLSPFRYEDFLAALRSEEYSFLIGEIHLVLLKSLLREEDMQQTSFGPLDLKDSVNSVLQFSDYFTWPAVLKAYLQSDPGFSAPLQILESCEYPFTSIENKLSLLKFLIDMVLLTTPIREDLVREGQTRYEDHCRSCHRMGDLLCCETCPAVYHLECVEPALTDVPNGDWLCPTCTLQQVKGVTDCVNDLEKSGLASRLECLGFDRNGHKYWFVCRRIFVESEDGNVRYYSTSASFEELLAALDPEELEASLCREIFLHREDILEQMNITASLTADLKGDKTSYLEKYDARLTELVSQKNAIVDTKAGQEEQVETTDLAQAIVGADEAKVLQRNHVSANGTAQPSILEDESLFRLGEEGTYKSYTNIYTTNTLALNKFQHAEERDRKRYLSHKFSLTPAAEFKWTTSLYGPKSSFLQALRTSLLALRDSLHSAFMHTNWHVVRKAWTVAVNNASTPRDFSRTLAVLAMCIRPVACNALWFDSLGHVRFHRQTAQERENKKKLDKKEKKEKDMEEEMFRVHTVHYTLGVKHQLWKMKGEEFRSHGQWGWLWVSATRPIKRINVDNMGLLRLAKVLKAETDATSEIESADTDVSTNQDPFRDVVDVSQAFNDPLRKVYPKVAKTRKLDALLAWRLRQQEMEKKVPDVKIEPPELPDEKPKDLNEFPYPCYLFECGTGCYSPICAQRRMQRSLRVNGGLEDVKDSKAIGGVGSAADTSEKYALQKLPTVKGKTAVRVPVAYPRTSSFVTRSAKRGLFVLEANELRRLARKRGQISVSGFISTAKANPSAWPYPCCRPAFRTCWLYRTSSARSLTDLALQLRIFWACLRWDDMQAKPPTVDGKNQVTTDTEITTTEILKHRTTGRFLDKTQYFCRRVVIPLELPKTVREVTPSRFGLRKRKRVESPRLSEPLVSEDWVDEKKLELWDIKQYYERNEKAAANAAIKKTNAMTNLFAGGKASAEQLSKLGVKQGSTVKVDRSKISQLPNSSRVEISGKTYLRFTIPGGKVALQAASGGLPVTKNTLATLLATTQKAGGAATTGGLKQLAIAKQIQKKQQQATPVKPNQVTVIRMPGANTTGVQQKLHVSRALDGKFLVRGLLPGQRLVQLSDGKFQLVGTPTVHKTPVADGKTASPNVTTTKLVTKQPSTVTVNRTSLSGNQVVPSTEGNIVKPAQVTNDTNAAAGELSTTSVEETKEAVSTGKMEVKIVSDAGKASTPAVSEKPTALLVQTTQGPRIILQGLQGNSLSAQEVQAIQEQVKSQLLKAQQLKQQADKGAKLPDTPLQIKIGIPAQRPSPSAPEKSIIVSEASETCGTNSSENEFVVTRDFIQQTIRKALKQENLNPDVEHKLLQLQRYQEKQKATTGSNVVPSNHKKKRVEESTDSESVASTPRGGSRVSLHDSSATGKPVMEEPVRVQRTVAKTIDRKQVMGEKLISLMMRHADNLRRAMLKYRDNLDRTLQAQTQAELRVATSEHYAMSPVPSPKLETRDSVAQERSDVRLSPDDRVSSPQFSKSSTKKRRTSAKDKDLTNRKNLHCICKTPYDSSKFYVGCDICLNWFHGECIGISEALSRTMTEYVCADCTKSKETNEIFCLCRQPYNESQFYICCDRCQDWFHGHCVGIVQAEADMIDEYICPNCQPDSTLNNANLRLLAEKDYEHISEVVRSLLKNRNSWPFREAVNPHTVPNYYEVIKDPVDLAKILRRLSTRQYRRLAEVVGDITKMFENCRYFNSNDSSIYRCAEALESYFVPRLHNIRKILTDS